MKGNTFMFKRGDTRDAEGSKEFPLKPIGTGEDRTTRFKTRVKVIKGDSGM